MAIRDAEAAAAQALKALAHPAWTPAVVATAAAMAADNTASACARGFLEQASSFLSRQLAWLLDLSRTCKIGLDHRQSTFHMTI